jgi:AraC-like DNA-binding protein
MWQYVRYFIFIVMFCFSLGFVSCNKPTNQNVKEDLRPMILKADSMLASNPKSAVRISYLLINKVMNHECADSIGAKVVDVYAQAIMLTLPKDSVYLRMIQIKDQSKLAKNQVIQFQALLWLAQSYLDNGKFFLSRKYAEDAVVIAPQINDNYHKARAYNVFGSLLAFVGELESAQKNLIKAMRLFEQNNDYNALSAVYINLGNNYIGLSENKMAYEYYQKARQTSCQLHDTLNYLMSLNSLGRLYTTTNPDSANYYFNSALSFSSPKWLIESLSTRFEFANFLVERKLFDSAEMIYANILKICQLNKIDGGVYRAMSGLGNVLEAKNHDKQALAMYQHANDLAFRAGETPVVIDLMNAERYMYIKMGDYRSGYKLLLKSKLMSDSLLSLEKQFNIHDLEMLYQHEKANLKNRELQLNVREMANRNFTNKVLLTVAILVVIALGGFLMVYYRLYRQRDVAYSVLFEQYKLHTSEPVNAEKLIEPVMNIKSAELNASALALEIEKYFTVEKPYLNRTLKIEDVAKKMGVSQKLLSSVINTAYGLHFNVFVNKYRIQEALELLSHPDYQNVKIEYIAKVVGFGSKVSFYNAFAQVTGSKPSDYRSY